MTHDIASLRPSLSEILGAENVSSDVADLLATSRSAYPLDTKRLFAGSKAETFYLVARPGNAQQVSSIVGICSEYGVPIVPYGGGSGICDGTDASVPAVAVDTKRLCTIEVSQRNRIVRAGAGLFWQELEDYLSVQGWTSGHFPQSIQSATVGGMVSTRGVGTFSGRYGKIDDMVRALEVVLPSGEIIRTPRYGDGLFPPPKRSCGPELRELFLGAEGALGIITEALLTIWRRAETRLWDTFTFPSTPVALTALEEIHATDFVPGLVRLYDEDESIPRLASLGYEPGQALLLLGYEGDPEMCDLACRRVALVCRAHAGEQRGSEGAEQWYRHRLNTKAVVDALSRDGGVGDAIEVAAPWDCLAQVWGEMRAALLPLCDTVHCHFSHFYRTGGSVYLIFVAATQAADPVSGMRHYNRCLRAALDACLAAGGSISHHHGVGRSKAQWMVREHGTSTSVLRGIKDLLDPQHLMNPGVLDL